MPTPPKPLVDTKTALITAGATAVIVALIAFIPASRPILVAACAALPQDGTVSTTTVTTVTTPQ